MEEVFKDAPAYFLMAAVGTTLYIIKTILVLTSGDAGDGDLSDSSDLEVDHIDGGATFSLVSLQSILAFFMGTGWIGLACVREWNIENPQAILYSAGFGFLMMLMSAFLTFQIKKLNTNPVSNIKSAAGKTGRAYTNIPEKGSGAGQVEITVDGKQQILQAMSSGEGINAFDAVRVDEVDDSGNLIVSKA